MTVENPLRGADEIRKAFLCYFEERGHLVVPSSSLVPRGDPTLLLTSAGMVQFKPYFTGEATPPSARLASCQKCFRTTDIDAVGDLTHLTFFEMLGNFSVGDYFKREAIAFAREFLTGNLALPPQRLWITIFEDDDEAFELWREVGVPAERIRRYGEKDNFWGPAGEEGPCGPCTEIFYDFGEATGCGQPTCGPNCDCPRFLEIWNLVFMQYYQDLSGQRRPLPKKNVDTGMGLERIAAVMQGKTSFYDADVFAPLIQVAERLTGRRYGQDEAVDRALRVMAEHGRAVTFLLADGVLPSNESRGYVLRRVLRRAVRFARTLGRKELFLCEMAAAVIANMGRVYPELREKRELILKIIELEEERFEQTLSIGLDILDDMIAIAKRADATALAGQEVFRLYDTYGFPPELTAEIAAEHGFAIDREGFEAALNEQRERGRAAHRFLLGERRAEVYQALALEPTTFVGYEELAAPAIVLGLLVDGQAVEMAAEGQEVEVVLNRTPFYGEAGGQLGDTGTIRGQRGVVQVSDAFRPLPDLIVHRGRVSEGVVAVGDAVEAEVDAARRLDIARNHTATHLLQAALRRVLGSHVRQEGSLVAPDRLRFDFSHLSPLSKEELAQIEHLVNEKIRQNLAVRVRHISFREAIDQGAIALFDEKYADEVRLVEVGEGDARFSAELCGGTHLRATGEVGFFHIISESSIGAGLRRIEAVTGRGAEAFVAERLALLEQAAAQLQTTPAELSAKVAALIEEKEAQSRRAAALEREVARQRIDSLLAEVEAVNGVSVLAARVTASSMESLREMGDMLRDRLGRRGVVVLGAIFDDRPHFVAMATREAAAKGVHAGDLVREVAKSTGGSGGGSPTMGQAGGRDKDKLGEALDLKRVVYLVHRSTSAHS